MPQYWRLCIAAIKTPAPHCSFRQLRNPDFDFWQPYLGGWTFPPQPLDLAIPVHLVILEHSQLGLLTLVLDLLGGGIHLLLALLGTTT